MLSEAIWRMAAADEIDRQIFADYKVALDAYCDSPGVARKMMIVEPVEKTK